MILTGIGVGEIVFVVGIRVRVTQFGKQRSFQCFHLFGLIVFDVVVAQQVQATVDDQVGPVGLDRKSVV